eukprot:1407099-Prymnesium_polylepis.1
MGRRTQDAVALTCHADHAADAGVGRRDGHLVLGGDEQPDGNADYHDQAAVHQQRGVVAEALVVCNALTDGVGDLGAREKGAQELEDDGEDASLLDGQRFGSDARRVGVRHIVRADAKGGREGDEAAEDDNPLVSVREAARIVSGQTRQVAHVGHRRAATGPGVSLAGVLLEVARHDGVCRGGGLQRLSSRMGGRRRNG